jgi:hypothetical protein
MNLHIKIPHRGFFFENLPKHAFMKKIASIFPNSKRLGHYWF